GDGQGAFDDVTDAAGLTTLAHSDETAAAGTNHKPSWGVTACDVDGDGWTDLMTTSYGRQFNNFYRNLGDGTFEDLTLSSGFGSDEKEDYSDNEFYLCYCEYHPDVPECDGAGSASIVCDDLANAWNIGMDDQPWRLGGNSSNTVCGDIDNDGDMDLLAVELAHWHIGGSSDMTELLVNDGFPAAPFVRPGNEATGLTRAHIMGWNEGDLGGAFADFDNDGLLDVLVASSDYPGTNSLLWQQQSDGTFVGVEDEAGAEVDRAHGIGLIDYDRDGDYDLVLGTSLMRWSASDFPPAPDDAYAYLLRNDGGQDANKMILHVRGSGAAGGANRDAVGARIQVTAGGATYTREIQGGFGLNRGQQDQLIIVGIGQACTADDVTITWPDGSGSTSSFTDVMANHVAIINQGEDLTYQALADYTASQ
ncbi:MAG: CRTAC1 family protein, partial [Deltaproteobacteria bacterium]|nr:CRTAC1 family protein [Deltaproteobacteria bacterium]